MREKLINIGIGCFLAFLILLAIGYIYLYVDGTIVYIEIKEAVVPREPYDTIDYIDLYGTASDGWYLANIFVIDSETDNFANSMIRYNRDTKSIVIPSDSFGFEPCIHSVGGI